MPEKVAIVGSRTWTNWEAVRDYVNSLEPDTVVVSGGARGVDQWAEIFANERGLETIIYRADWRTHGKRAGILRNKDIIDASDRVVAFWCDASTGTQNSIERAWASKKPVLIFRPPKLDE